MDNFGVYYITWAKRLQPLKKNTYDADLKIKGKPDKGPE
jgi:hypothetical protein